MHQKMSHPIHQIACTAGEEIMYVGALVISEYSTVTSNLESLHQSLNQGTQSIENDANAFQTSNNINTSSGSISCATTTLSHTSHVSKMVCTGSSEDPKKCIELQSNNSVMDTDAMSTRLPKSSCCETLSTSSLNITSPVTATTSTGATLQSDLTREHWYAHAHAHAHRHPHHTSHHPGTHHPQQLEELVMYAPATTPSISKFGLDSSTESYLNARYNVNVKGVCHERTSSFFDIPAVTHPYCYRFPSPPAGILKKSDDETSAFCNNSQPTSATSLPIGHHYHSSKIEHPDSTTTHLSHHHHHHHSHSHNSSQFNNLHQSAYSSAFKFSHSGVISTSATTAYHHYNSQVAAGYHNLRPAGELSPTLTPLPVPTSTDGEMKYDGSPYNPTISSTYALRPTGVEADTVTSTEADVKFENLYSSNAISTSQTVNQRRGSLQLWQFLVALLDEPTTSASCIAWTGRGMEFKLIEPEEVARRWGIQKNRPAMNYDKLSRSLRYYYEKGIMQKVNGERYVYRFVCDPDALFNMAYGHLTGGTSKGEHENMISVSKSMIGVSDSLLRSNMGSTPTTVDQEIHRDRVLSGSLSNNNSSLKSSDAFFYETAQKF